LDLLSATRPEFRAGGDQQDAHELQFALQDELVAAAGPESCMVDCHERFTCGCGASRDNLTALRSVALHFSEAALAGDAFTVQSRLDAFLAPEDVELRCECRAAEQTRTRRWTSTPAMLVLQASRFQMVQGADVGKVEAMLTEAQSVNLPTLDATPYDLVAVVDHVGAAADTGHYTCSVQVDGRWLKFDDDDTCVQVRPASVATIARSAYLLFYRRRAP
jgi:uncharacterized UBP type Zn finger protein